MQVARVLVDEMATAVVALACDGQLYDVDRLEAGWHIDHPLSGRGFHTRVVSAGGEGLDELDARLRSMTRPASARLRPEDYLPLPPCDVERAAYLQLAPYDEPGPAGGVLYDHRDARGLVGHGQPVPVFCPEGSLTAEIGLAVILGDDLWQARPREAERAILGTTLVIDWTRHGRPWTQRAPCPASPAQLGPTLLSRHRLRDLASLEVRIEVGDRSRSAGRIGDWPRPPGQTLAWLSHHLPLRAGDVVGLGCLRGGRLGPDELAFGTRLSATLHPLQRLEGWATAAEVARL